MIYWLNRRAERALEGYLARVVSGSMRVYRSADLTPRQFPCAVVRVHTGRRFDGEMYAANIMEASVVVMTEYARVINASAQVLQEFEEVEEAAASSVKEALFIEDLAAQLNAVGVQGITFSLAQIGDDTTKPVTDNQEEDGMVSMVFFSLLLHAGAKEF